MEDCFTVLIGFVGAKNATPIKVVASSDLKLIFNLFYMFAFAILSSTHTIAVAGVLATKQFYGVYLSWR
jgi:hypothetical protein